ncbi:hypothetical protein ACTXT7_014211 [Hymenolepis weldensis]
MSVGREIFDIPAGETREWMWNLAKWNADFLHEIRGQLIEITLGAFELGCDKLKESCCLAIATDIRQMGSKVQKMIEGGDDKHAEQRQGVKESYLI